MGVENIDVSVCKNGGKTWLFKFVKIAKKYLCPFVVKMAENDVCLPFVKMAEKYGCFHLQNWRKNVCFLL